MHSKSCKVNLELLIVRADCGVDLQAEDNDGRNVLHHYAIAGPLTSLKGPSAFSVMRQGWSNRPWMLLAQHRINQYAAEMRKKDQHPDTFDGDRWPRTEKHTSHGGRIGSKSAT